MASRIQPTLVCGSSGLTACISNDRNLLCFGLSPIYDGSFIPLKENPILKNVKSVYIGGCTFVCLDTTGNIFTFGTNEDGQLGVGLDYPKLKFTTEPQQVNLPPCSQISCGYNFIVCLCNGSLYSFGYNGYGQLGVGNTSKYSFNIPQKLEFPKEVEFIECGGYHTFCKTKNNEIYCWGGNESGQLGLGNTDNQHSPILCSFLPNENIIDIKIGYQHSLILTDNGDVFSCGSHTLGQLGRECDGDPFTLFYRIPELPEIARIECGYYHSMCIDVNNNLYVFGDNRYGQLGLGDTDNRFKPMKHPSLSNIIDISKGGYHSIVKSSNNEIYGFGRDILYIQIQPSNIIYKVFKWISSLLENKIKGRDQLTPIQLFKGNEDVWLSIESKITSRL